MTPTQFSLIKELCSVVAKHSKQQLFIQRPVRSDGNFFVQIITPLAIFTISVDKLIPEQLVTGFKDIGTPEKWSKVTKGLIASSCVTDIPSTRAAAVAKLGESQVGAVQLLLNMSDPLYSVDMLTKPGLKLAIAESSSKTIWAYNPAGGEGIENLKASWSKNVEKLSGVCTIINPWVGELVKCFPEYKDGSDTVKLDGMAMGSIGDRTGVHIVSRTLGMVLSCAGANMPSDKETAIEVSGVARRFVLHPDNTFDEIEEREKDMKATLIDPSQLMPKKDEAVNKQDIPMVENKSVNRQDMSLAENKPVNKQAVAEHTEFYAKPTPNVDKEPTTESLVTKGKTASGVVNEAGEQPEEELTVADLFNVLSTSLDTIKECEKATRKALKALQKKYTVECKEAAKIATAARKKCEAEFKEKLQGLLGL